MNIVRGLVDGIGRHTITGDPADGAEFRQRIQEVLDALVLESCSQDLIARAGSVVDRLEDHNRRTLRRHALQTAELQNMVKMLTATIVAVSAASNANVSILGEIEKQISTVSELDDVRIIKAKLSDCLTNIRSEAERQRKDTSETIQELSQGLEKAQNNLANGGEPKDRLTGLPLRAQAEVAIAQSGQSGVPAAYVAVMVLDRLQTLNMRFGQEAGDEILVKFVHTVRDKLQTGDRLFRWSGPTFLALLPRSDGLERTRGEIGRLMEARLEHTIQTPSRSIMVPVTARWTVFPMMAAPRLFYQRIDNFAAKPDVNR